MEVQALSQVWKVVNRSIKSLKIMELRLLPNRTPKWFKFSTDTCLNNWTNRPNFKEKWANSIKNSTAYKMQSKNMPKTKYTSKWSSQSTKIRWKEPKMCKIYSVPKSTNSTHKPTNPLKSLRISSNNDSNSSKKLKATKIFCPKTRMLSSNSSKAAKPTSHLPKTTQSRIW